MLGALAAAIWCLDFEFTQGPGERPVPICMVAHEVRTGCTMRMWLQPPPPCPFDPYEDAVFVAYMAAAEASCFLAMGWPVPPRWLDLLVEFRVATNGIVPPGKRGLLNALAYFGLSGISLDEKDQGRELAMRGAPFAEWEAVALFAYNESDVTALRLLLLAMLPSIDWERAVELRGRYMVATARMQHLGIPIDVERLHILKKRWPEIQRNLMLLASYRYAVNGRGAYNHGSFDARVFEAYLLRRGIRWPRHAGSGRLKLDDDTFKMLTDAHPELRRLRDTRTALSQWRMTDLPVGADGRNRTALWAFSSRTGRTQPSTSEFIFGPAVWLRGLIKPDPGMAVAYVDLKAAEWGIAAALSGDARMQSAYRSGDPYLRFAELARETLIEARRKRPAYKIAGLGVLYGMGPDALAAGINDTVAQARWLMGKHRSLFPQFWKWSDAASTVASLYGHLETSWGWALQLPGDSGEGVNQHLTAAKWDRTSRNFLVQATGADLLRVIIMELQDRGVSVIAPVHDAVLIEATIDTIDQAVETTELVMAEVSEAMLGIALIAEVDQVVRYPARFMDEKRGRETWNTVWKMLGVEP